MNFYKPNLQGLTLIVDGAHAIRRAIYQPSYRELSNGVGMPTGAVYGFFRILTAAISKFSATSLVVCFEGGHSQRREEIYGEYKSRGDKVDEVAPDTGMTDFQYYVHQLNWVRTLLTSMGLVNVSIQGKEGDDVIFQVASLLSGDKIILSEDRDFCTLVSPTCKLYRPIKDELIALDGFKDSTGLPTPKHFLYSKVILGDGSDNIPSVMKGVGEKTVNSILENIPEEELCPEVILREAFKGDWRAKKLATAPVADINRNLDLIDISREEFTNLELMEIQEHLMHPPMPNPENSRKLMYALEFGEEIRNYLSDISGRFCGGLSEDLINKEYIRNRMMGLTTAVIGG